MTRTVQTPLLNETEVAGGGAGMESNSTRRKSTGKIFVHVADAIQTEDGLKIPVDAWEDVQKTLLEIEGISRDVEAGVSFIDIDNTRRALTGADDAIDEETELLMFVVNERTGGRAFLVSSRAPSPQPSALLE